MRSRVQTTTTRLSPTSIAVVVVGAVIVIAIVGHLVSSRRAAQPEEWQI